jgi:hypothetical protein
MLKSTWSQVLYIYLHERICVFYSNIHQSLGILAADLIVQLIPWCSVLVGQLIVIRLIKKSYNEIGIFVVITSHLWSLSLDGVD